MFCFNFRCFRLFDYIIAMKVLYRNALYNSVLYKNYSFHFTIVWIAHIKAQTFEHLAEYQFHAEKYHKPAEILTRFYRANMPVHTFAKIRKEPFREKTRGVFASEAGGSRLRGGAHKRVDTKVSTLL